MRRLDPQDLERREAQAPLMVRTAETIARHLGFLGDSIAEASARYGDPYWAFGEAHCQRLWSLMGGEARYQKAVQGYCLLSLEYLQLQKRLEQEGRYLLRSFEEARARVYANPEVMEGYYLDGLALALLFWPNHFGIHRFFLDRFLPCVPSEGRCLEVGTGHGITTAALAGARPGVAVDGVDVSPYSIAYTRGMLRAAAIPDPRVSLVQADIAAGLPFPDAGFAAGVCGEVLEHLESPLAALRELRRVTRPGGAVFLNIAVYPASLDHLYLFRSAGEARDLVREAGLEIGPELALPVRPGDDPEAREVPVNYACVARRPAS